MIDERDDLQAAAGMLDEMGATPYDYNTPEGMDGSLQALKGFLRPSAGAGRTLLLAGAPFPMFADKAESLVTGKETTAHQEAYFGEVVEGLGGNAVEAWTPDPVTMSSTAKTINMVGNVVGSVPQMIGTPGVFLSNAGIDPAVDLTRQGVRTEAALGVGAVNLAVNALGMRLPAAFGTSLPTRLATGAGSNLALGVAADASSAGILSVSGAEDAAAGYDLTDPYARGLDLLMGLAFGAIPGNPHIPAPAREAVLVARNADHLERTSMPGTPVAAGADLKHQTAMSDAIAQVLRGEQVNITDAINPADFMLKPELQPQSTTVPVSNYAAFRHALESGGKADAAATTSGALGIDQFIPSTWVRLVDQTKPAWAEGKTRAEILAMRTDPAKSAQIVAVLDANSERALTAAGQPVTAHNLYASHHFGEGKGVRFAQAAGDTPMSSILTEGQIKANPYLKGLTKAEAIENWDRRAGKAGVRMERTAFADPNQIARDSFVEAAARFDVPLEIADQLAPRAAQDAVTGFFDGRVDSFKFDILNRAQSHVASTGEPGYFVSSDLFNLGGLNASMGDRAEAANVHYKAIAQVLDQELRATGGDVVSMRTGGDELGSVLINVDKPRLDAAVARAQERIAEYAKAEGLADIPHPKRSNEKGVGLHIGTAAIAPNVSVRQILDRADDGVNASKNGARNVTSEQAGTAGAVAPGGEAGRTGGGNAAQDGSVRQQSERMAEIAALRAEVGWSERGGQILREGPLENDVGGPRASGDVVGRTKWIAKKGQDGGESNFWRTRPDASLTESQALAAFDKFEAGGKLSAKEQRFIEHAQRQADIYGEQSRTEAQEMEFRAEADRQEARKDYKSGLSPLVQSYYDAIVRRVNETPDARVVVGSDADGNPIIRTISDEAASIDAERQAAIKEAEGITAAANCFISRGMA